MMRKSKSKLPGFTLIEVLVVVVIIVLLITLLVPSLRQFQKQVSRGRSQAIINLIDGACKMHYQDFKEYPDSKPITPSGTTWYGRHRLVEWLTGYLPATAAAPDVSDGQDGYGFRAGGKIVYGPYNGTEKLQTTKSQPYAFVDTFGNEIFYYQCRFDDDAKKYMYYASDNNDATKAPLLGSYETNADSQLFQTTFLLMSAGADKEFSAWRDNNSTDDVTNFFPGAK